MRQPIKYFVFNKESDYARGSSWNIQLLSPGISIADPEEGIGIFFSRLLDSREKQTQYHRIQVEGEQINEATVRLRIYASESRQLPWNNGLRDIEDILKDASLSPEAKQEIFWPYCKKDMESPRDMLLHEVKGRYVWIQILLMGQEHFLPRIHKIKIIFPKDTWLKYLPDVYQEDVASASFVERYLGIFQSLYQDMTREIRHIPQYLDPEATQGAFLEWLATWISLEDTYLWSQEQLRYLLVHGMELYQKRGTAEYLQEMVKLYMGSKPYVVEHHQLEPYQGNYGYSRRLLSLYGKNSYIFTIVVNINRQISNKEYHILTRIVERAKPAHMECNMIVLEPYIFLDKHSYLGINSVLGNYGAFVLDGQSSIPFTVLTEDEG